MGRRRGDEEGNNHNAISIVPCTRTYVATVIGVSLVASRVQFGLYLRMWEWGTAYAALRDAGVETS